MKRIIWADALKGWLMILVIIGHAIQSVLGGICEQTHLWNMIYSFHMPAFIAVSGYLSYRPDAKMGGGNFVSYVKRRFQQLMIPYFIWSLILYFNPYRHSPKVLSDIIFAPAYYFWFLWALFFICVLFKASQIIAAKVSKDELLVILPLCMVLTGAMVILDLRIFGFQYISYYMMFYTLGYIIHRFRFFKIRNAYMLILLTLIWMFMAFNWSMHTLPEWIIVPYMPTSLMLYVYRTICATLAILVLLNLSALSSDKKSEGDNQNQVCSFITNLGRLSLGVYVVHLTIIFDMPYALSLVSISVGGWLGIAIIAIMALFISWLIVQVLTKNRFTNRLLLGKV